MDRKAHHIAAWILLSTLMAANACSSLPRGPELGGLYNALAQHEDPYRNPVILIPGVLGSRLVEKDSHQVVWGTFGLARINPNSPTGAGLVALPMQAGKKLNELNDDLISAGALDRVVINFGGYPIELNAYAYILGVLGVGGYRDEQLAESGAVDWGDQHFTCFQFDYDWRRDIVESAKALDQFIKEKKQYVVQELERRFGITHHDVKFDIVAHSMGGLVARYYLRYGSQDLPADGRLPDLSWSGNRDVDNLIMVGTPNAGSLDALLKLVEGYKPAFLLPHYSAAVIGTMPAMYQLLPRSRHQPLRDSQGHPEVDIFDPMVWIRNDWGLADPKQDKFLKMLLPEIKDPAERRNIALDHLQKVLARAKQFSAALDLPAEPPKKLSYYLVAGDAKDTPKAARFNQEGKITVTQTGPGDTVVLRSSALMDERLGKKQSSRLISPIRWAQVLFLLSDHRDITNDPAFTDNLLYILLESQRKE